MMHLRAKCAKQKRINQTGSDVPDRRARRRPDGNDERPFSCQAFPTR